MLCRRFRSRVLILSGRETLRPRLGGPLHAGGMARTKTVTFLFTDAVSSTELRAQLGDDAADELFARHLKLLREAVSAAGGREVKDLGDGLMAAFTSAADAVACGVQMQRAVAEGADEVRLRVGLHAGEAA